MIWMYELDLVGFIGPRADKLESAYQLHLRDHVYETRRMYYELNVVDAHDEFRKQAPQLRLMSMARSRHAPKAD